MCLDDRIRFTLNVLMFSVVLYHSLSLGDRVRFTLKICSFFSVVLHRSVQHLWIWITEFDRP